MIAARKETAYKGYRIITVFAAIDEQVMIVKGGFLIGYADNVATAKKIIDGLTT